jgi:uncharacterized protein YbjT (DUF2867 family)
VWRCARREAKSDAAQNHWIAERLLDRTPMLTAHVRPTFFAEWLDRYWATDGTSGVIRLPMGDREAFSHDGPYSIPVTVDGS